ncbi:MAG: hypothetical protein E7680_05520 [Ruminococcaceae bacterium]|nr:hypothetical protein [Oscillospiraceae bacterium]
MFFYSNRQGGSPLGMSGGCLGSLLAFLVVIAFLIVCAIYFGTIILIGFLILGAIIGLICAIFALLKAFPQTIKDMSCQAFNGSAFIVFLKKTGYFYICISKYSLYNDVAFAKNFFQKFTVKRWLSFTKWMYLMVAIAVILCGISVLGILLAASALFLLIFLSFTILLSAALLCLMMGVCLIIIMFVGTKHLILSIPLSFFPSCYRFKGKRKIGDLGIVIKTFFAQWGVWVKTVWRNTAQFVHNFRQHAKLRRWFSPVSLFSIGLLCMLPIGTSIVIAIATVISWVVFLLGYLVDAFWIIIRSIFKF